MELGVDFVSRENYRSYWCLTQIKPEAPLLWYPFVNSFKFQLCNHTPPGTNTGSRQGIHRVMVDRRSASFTVGTTMVYSSNLRISYLIGENLFAPRHHRSSCCNDPRISPPTFSYECPRLLPSKRSDQGSKKTIVRLEYSLGQKNAKRVSSRK